MVLRGQHPFTTIMNGGPRNVVRPVLAWRERLM
jgi:hypothetical protein